MKPLKNIVFDLGAVLINWNPMYVYKNEFDTPEELAYFFNEICTIDWNENQDAGYPLHQATKDLIALYPTYAPKIKMFYDRWEEMLGEAIPGSVDILQKCVENPELRVLALTNWSAETFPIALQKFDFLQWFEGIVVSGEEKTRKPFLAIYHTLLNRYELNAEETLFIDDNQRNIEAAKSLGITGIHFKSPEQLSEKLIKLAII